MSRYALEALLRPPVEFYSTVTASCGALICLTQAPLLMLTPWQARLMACALMLLAMRRGWQNRALSPQPAAPAALCADQQENPGQPPAAVSR